MLILLLWPTSILLINSGLTGVPWNLFLVAFIGNIALYMSVAAVAVLLYRIPDYADRIRSKRASSHTSKNGSP
jgi:hypothetical protein